MKIIRWTDTVAYPGVERSLLCSEQDVAPLQRTLTLSLFVRNIRVEDGFVCKKCGAIETKDPALPADYTPNVCKSCTGL